MSSQTKRVEQVESYKLTNYNRISVFAFLTMVELHDQPSTSRLGENMYCRNENH